MANDKNIEKVFDLSPDNKVLWFRGKKIDLTGTNKIFQVDSLYWRWLFYNKAETTPEDPNYPIPDSSGKIILFNRKKNELGNKGEFKANTQEAGSLPDNNYGLIMALGIKFLPFLDVATLEALQKANYRLVIKKVDSQARVEKFLLDINQTSKASYTLGERTITDTAFATPDGIMPPKALVNIEQQSPLKLDETRYILLNPGEIFEVYLEPENWDTTIDIPYPGHTKTLRKFRQYGYLSIHGLFTDVEKYI